MVTKWFVIVLRNFLKISKAAFICKGKFVFKVSSVIHPARMEFKMFGKLRNIKRKKKVKK